jgi:hypothetical protein
MIATALLGFAAVFRADVAKAASGPLLLVDPQSSIFSNAPVGKTFLVNVSVANITMLAGIQFTLTWDHNLLKCNSMTEVFFHDTLITAPVDNPSNINVIKKSFNNTAGTATYGVTWTDGGLAAADGYDPANITTTGDAFGIPGYPWPNGEHGVAIFNFTILQAPNATVTTLSSPLTLSTDILGDVGGLPITHTNVAGLYQNNFVAGVPGDLSNPPDGHVGIDDAIIMANAFLTNSSSPNWNAAADLNGDGVINILDTILLGSLFGHP